MKQIIAMLLLLLSLTTLNLTANAKDASAQFALPQESRTCDADTDSRYDGCLYKDIKVGISFHELKKLVDAAHHTLLPARQQEQVLWVYESADTWPIAKTTWRPQFHFIEDKGVYRLEAIQGKLPPEYSTLTDVIGVLVNKYGEPTSRGDDIFWRVGTHPETAISLDRTTGWLYFRDYELLEQAVQRKHENAPGL